MDASKKLSPQEIARQRELKVKEITDKLETGLKTLFEGENFKRYLSVMSKFHSYSFNNTLLITLQKPDATLVAGFRTWQKDFERNVNKGEKGIKIFAPSTYKTTTLQEKIDPETDMPVLGDDGKPVMEEVEEKHITFRVVPVFDISQTNGKELPTLGVDELKGDVKNFDKFFGALKDISPVPIIVEDINRTGKGYFSHITNDIHIKKGMDEVQIVKTAIHEIAHSMLHSEDSEKSKNTKEVEAESIAYTVCQHFGIDTSDYSFAYVAQWGTSVKMPELKASLETIQKTASEIISKVEGKLRGLEVEIENKSEKALPSEPEINTTREKPRDNGIIGNTPYRDIRDKTYIKTKTENLQSVEEFLSAKDISYSGRVYGDKVTFTVSKEDSAALQGFVDDLDMAHKKIKELSGRISQEEIDRANSVNLPQFLMSQGVELKRVGKEYIMKEHDSVHIVDNIGGEKGKWFRFSENVGGGNIDFCEKFLGMSFREAVEALNNGREINYIPHSRDEKTEQKPAEKGEVDIKANADSKRVIAYLTKTRGLDYSIVADLLKKGKLIQEEKTGNAVFLIKDENGKTVGAEKVGTLTDKRFKGIDPNTVNGYGFETVYGKGENLFFFESAIDALSFADIHQADIGNARLVSMMGLKPSIVEATIQRYGIPPEKVYLCSDNDEKGNLFADKLRSEYPGMKRILPPDPSCKDWNDQLLKQVKAREDISEPDISEKLYEEKPPEKQAVFSIYQLKSGDEYHGIRFEGFEENKEHNLNYNDYDLVYTGDWNSVEGTSAEQKLDAIFQKFNLDRPEDFKGHSLSISDVVAVGFEGEPESFTAHYVDNVGFVDMPDFFKERTAELQKPKEHDAPAANNPTELQKKAVEIFKRYENLSLQNKIDIIAQAFGCTTGVIETSPCTGKWRGTSDMSIRFDNGMSLFIGNNVTPKTKTAAMQKEYVNSALTQYNPEIIKATKEAAFDVLKKREAIDNAAAAQKGLKPYTLLNVEFNDGKGGSDSYLGWYYVTLAVDGKIHAHMETGLNYDILDGKVSETPTRDNYFVAGALKEADYVFNNVGFSSTSELYSLHISDEVRERAEKRLAEFVHSKLEKAVNKDMPYVTVKPFSKVDFNKIGLDENKQYTIPEFNAALAEADRLYKAADEYENRIDTFTVSLHIGGKTAQYSVMHGAEYGTLSAIMNAVDLVNASNIGITQAEKEIVADIEKAAAPAKSRSSKEQSKITEEDMQRFISAAHDIGVDEAKKANGIVVPAKSEALTNLIAEKGSLESNTLSHEAMERTNKLLEAFGKGVAEEVHRQTVKDFPELFDTSDSKLHEAFDKFKNNHGDLSHNALEFLEKAEKQMRLNHFGSFDDFLNIPIVRSNYGTPERINKTIFEGKFDEKLSEITREIDGYLNEREQTAPDRGKETVDPEKNPENTEKTVIGNTAVRDIANKFFIKLSPEKAVEIADKLNKSGMKFGGVIRDGEAKITIDRADLQRYRELTSPAVPEQQKQAAEKPAVPPKEKQAVTPAKKKSEHAKPQKTEEKRPSVLGAIAELKKNSSAQPKKDLDEKGIAL